MLYNVPEGLTLSKGSTGIYEAFKLLEVVTSKIAIHSIYSVSFNLNVTTQTYVWI
jgi:hypothetical protein